MVTGQQGRAVFPARVSDFYPTAEGAAVIFHV